MGASAGAAHPPSWAAARRGRCTRRSRSCPGRGRCLVEALKAAAEVAGGATGAEEGSSGCPRRRGRSRRRRFRGRCLRRFRG